MEFDISDLLDNWEYDPDDNIRIIDSKRGSRMLQIRLPLGIEQYFLEGRPDGKTPFNFQSLLDYYKNEIESNPSLIITSDEFLDLQDEGLMFYNRYISLFQIGEYEMAARDTRHNLDLCDVVEEYAESVESKDLLLQYRPYILHINALSRYMIALADDDYIKAETILNHAIHQIESLKSVDTPLFNLELKRSLLNLKKAKKTIDSESKNDKSLYELKLKQAVDNEEYEEAARIRDMLKSMNDSGE